MKQVFFLSAIILMVVLGLLFSWVLDNRNDFSGTAYVAVTILVGAYFLTIFGVVFALIRENRDPKSSLAWVQVLLFLPVQGFVLYLVFGMNYRKRKMFNRKMREDVEMLRDMEKHHMHVEQIPQIGEPNSIESKMMNLLLGNNRAHMTYFNRAESLPDGKIFFQRLMQDMAEARHHLHIMFYLMQDDETGETFVNMLLRKANEGVSIKLIYDDVGSWDFSRRYRQTLLDSGIELVPFFPVRLKFFSNKVNYRNHRKIVVIDGLIGYMGGNNIGNEYLGLSDYFGYWRDTQIRVTGDAVYSLQRVFLTDWIFAAGNPPNLEILFPEHNVTDRLPIQIVTSGPDSEWPNILHMYFTAISNAYEYIYLETPYLVLDEAVLMALKTAALSGIDVQLVLPAKPDHIVVHLASKSYFAELLEAGVRIFQYKGGFIHTKVLIVDGRITSIGTANLDNRSLKMNFEVNAVIYDRAFSELIKHQFMVDIEKSTEVFEYPFSRRDGLQKTKESLARLLSPLL